MGSAIRKTPLQLECMFCHCTFLHPFVGPPPVSCPAPECLVKRQRYHDDRRNEQRQRERKYAAQYREEHRDEQRGYMAKYHETHKDKEKAERNQAMFRAVKVQGKKYPCTYMVDTLKGKPRKCGRMSVNRWFCPTHLTHVSRMGGGIDEAYG